MMNLSGEEETETFDQLGKIADWLEEKLSVKREQMMNNKPSTGEGIWGYTG